MTYLRMKRRDDTAKMFNQARFAMEYTPTMLRGKVWAIWCSSDRRYVAEGTRQEMMDAARILNNNHARQSTESKLAADQARCEATGLSGVHHATGQHQILD